MSGGDGEYEPQQPEEAGPTAEISQEPCQAMVEAHGNFSREAREATAVHKEAREVPDCEQAWSRPAPGQHQRQEGNRTSWHDEHEERVEETMRTHGELQPCPNRAQRSSTEEGEAVPEETW